MPSEPIPEFDVELASRPRFLEGSVRLKDGSLVAVRLTWQAWEEATGLPGPSLPSPDDRIAESAAYIAATENPFAGRTVDGFRLVEPVYIRMAQEMGTQATPGG
jgi:hypothetical protein